MEDFDRYVNRIIKRSDDSLIFKEAYNMKKAISMLLALLIISICIAPGTILVTAEIQTLFVSSSPMVYIAKDHWYLNTSSPTTQIIYVKSTARLGWRLNNVHYDDRVPYSQNYDNYEEWISVDPYESSLTQDFVKVVIKTTKGNPKFESRTATITFWDGSGASVKITQPGKSSGGSGGGSSTSPSPTVWPDPIGNPDPADFYLVPPTGENPSSSDGKYTVTHNAWKNADMYYSQPWITDRYDNGSQSTFRIVPNTEANARDGSVRAQIRENVVECIRFLQCAPPQTYNIALPASGGSQTVTLPKGYQYIEYGSLKYENNTDWIGAPVLKQNASRMPSSNNHATVTISADAAFSNRNGQIVIKMGNDRDGTYTVAYINVTQERLLTAPTLKADNVTSTSVKLSWNAVSGATNYSIKVNGGYWKSITGTSLDVALTPGQTYYFNVTANNATGSSQDSNATYVTALTAPTLKADNVTSTSVKLSWNAVANATSYSIKVNGGPWKSITGTSLNVALTPGQTYYFNVTANNATGSSQDSNATYVTALT